MNEQPDAPERRFTSVIEVDGIHWVVNIGALGIKMFDYKSDAEYAAAAINQQIEGILRALGLYAVFYDGDPRPIAAFVLEQDAKRYAVKYASGEVSWQIRHVQVVEEAAPAALPETARARARDIVLSCPRRRGLTSDIDEAALVDSIARTLTEAHPGEREKR